ncbi:tripartite tricarboxylate transporter substrate-binding protein [Cupriavidus oxalaticus]|uniref:Tripartite tricarboxylate transporter substrate binding protein n=1 Tax=Cupriavidus oxalaticus TaxID=96344 RepID=A0A5P3VS66_9BURK|nr:tripartite tricarboxylate transporter substrate-binding protein [Cupriavidus oxalaticus]QEZ48957.1 hypothetical protein D2917_32365 [Cupriavidus oxalaticus]
MDHLWTRPAKHGAVVPARQVAGGCRQGANPAPDYGADYSSANPDGFRISTEFQTSISRKAKLVAGFRDFLCAGILPYKGTSPAMTDLIGGRTQFMLDAVSSALPYIKDGRVRALALTSKDALPALPGVPTLDGSVMPGFVAPTWHGILLPAGTSKDVVRRWNSALATATRDPAVVAQFAPQGVAFQTSTPEQFTAYLKAETRRWEQAARAAGVEQE